MKKFNTFAESTKQDLKIGDRIRTKLGGQTPGIITKIEGDKIYFDHATATYQTVWSGAKGKPKQYVAHRSNVVKEEIDESIDSKKMKTYHVVNKTNPKEKYTIKAASDFEMLEKIVKRPITTNDIKFFKQNYSYTISEDLSVTERCWDGYKPTPGVKPYEKGSCMKEDDDIQEESEHEGKKVTLNKPFRTPDGPKKFAVYVKNDKGNVVKVTFGDPNMEIKRDDPERRKNYRARHNCSDPGPKWKANYWSCKMWAKKPVSKMTEAKNSFDFSELDGPKTKRVVGGVVGLSGTSPEDALTTRFKSMGYQDIVVTNSNDVIIVSATTGKNKEKNYYKLKKSVSEVVSSNSK